MRRIVPRYTKRCLALVLLAGVAVTGLSQGSGGEECAQTPRDSMGPYYEANAPVRESVGTGYVLEGEVLSASNCEPLPDARVELWMAGPDGDYGDAYRATLPTDEEGGYRFESHFPPSYGSRPPHIHIRVTAPGHEPLVTQHYPEPDTEQAEMDLVLRAR